MKAPVAMARFGLVLASLAALLSLTPTSAQATRRTPEVCEAFLTKALPYIPQVTNYTCGPACLESVSRYWFNRSPGEMELAHLMGTTPYNGTTPKQLADQANRLGLYTHIASGLRANDLAACVARGETVVVFWSNGGVNHFSVVLGITEHSVFLMDPSRRGPFAELPLNQFLSGWRRNYAENNGVAIRMSPRPL